MRGLFSVLFLLAVAGSTGGSMAGDSLTGKAGASYSYKPGKIQTRLPSLNGVPFDKVRIDEMTVWIVEDPNVIYHGKTITILWDKTGEKYDRGKGLQILADGKQIAQSVTLARLTGQLH